MIFGLGSALVWGFADLGAAIVGRRLGSFVTTVLAQVASVIVIGLLYLALRPAWSASAGDVAVLAVNGVLISGAYLSLYRALELGPVALVSPIVAAYAVVGIVLAVTVLGESLAGLVLAGAVVTMVGVVLTSADPRGFAGGRMSRAGVPVALLAMVLFGMATLVLGREAQRIGWLTATTLGRGFSVLCLLLVVAVKRPALRAAGVRGVGLAAAVGLADIAGVALFSLGAERGYVSIVVAASATFVLIPVAGGIVLFGERPAPSQLAGVAFVVAGLLMLGLG